MTNTSIKIAPLFIVPLFIAPLSKADYDAWLKLWQNYLTFYETRLPPSTTEKTSQVQRAAEGVCMRKCVCVYV